jgi:ceramide glucosyltransferase
MSPLAVAAIHACGFAVTGAAAAYAILALVATLRWRRAPRPSGAADALVAPTALTVLKPLCGAEPQLYESLRSLCAQDYPRFQVLCGVREQSDPAVAVVRRLQREFPALDLDLVIDPTVHGCNLKVSNLINMMPLARHDWLVLADSDVRVPPRYLERVAAPLADPGVGIVTCPYHGIARGGAWSLLLAAFINEWFMPSVFVAAALGSRAFAFGATIALRRDALDAIGGFRAIADQLADDYRLGELTRARGLETVLSKVIVDTHVDEPRAGDLIRHELRWLRTIRAVRPGGYAASLVTFTLPVAVLGALVDGWGPAALALLAVAAAARVLLHFVARRIDSAALQLWVVPAGDSLAFALWCWGFVSRSVQWRHTRYRVARDGSVQPIA